MAPIIALLTDFGIQDGYVASMKGVILSICPEACMVDITHMIPPQDVRSGAFVLGTVYRDFPEGTVHLAVVDPGVGTKRLALAIEAGGYFFVGPDNGLFSLVLAEESNRKARSLENPAYWHTVSGGTEYGKAGDNGISTTFHGRDIFAPVAAHLAKGIDPRDLGPESKPIISAWTTPVLEGEELEGEVIHIDRFGNCITNIARGDIEAFAPQSEWQRIIELNGEGAAGRVGFAKTYGEVAPLSGLALIGSSNRLEVAVNQGDAAKALGIAPGSRVSVIRKPLSS